MLAARISAERVLGAPVQRVWTVVADPTLHRHFDAAGMVGGCATAVPRAVGDVFTMEMTYASGGCVEHYQSDNHLTRYEPGRAIAWATATRGGVPLGWTWCYELAEEPGDPNRTRVRLTYDWTDTPEENVHRFGVPLTDERGLAQSLELLDRACQTH